MAAYARYAASERPWVASVLAWSGGVLGQRVKDRTLDHIGRGRWALAAEATTELGKQPRGNDVTRIRVSVEHALVQGGELGR